MGTFKLVQIVEEERMLVCDGIYHRVDPARIICGNILRIKVTIVDGATSQVRAIQEYDTIERKPHGGSYYDETIHHGACISDRQRQPFSTSRRYTYGPRNAKYFTFIHCKQCQKRWAWKRFKKVDL